VAKALRSTGVEGMGVRQADYRVLVCTQCPGILVELGYLSNSHDARMLADAAVQARLAHSIADGIAEYLKR
jgi:N-acetylmuramoyl-L-alanine amidase